MTTRSARSASRRIAVRTFCGLAQDRLRARGHVLAGERGERVLGLGADGLGDAGRHEVHHRDRGAVAVRERVREPQRQLRVRAAADRDEDAPDLARAALLDHGDVARGLAHDLVDRGGDHRARRPSRWAPDLPPQPKIIRSASCSAAASTMPGRRVPPDAHERVDRRPLGDVVEDLLEQAPRLAGARRALGQGHALGHLDDAQRRQLAGARLQQRRADPDQLLGGERVGDRDQDPRRERLAAHRAVPGPSPRRRRAGLAAASARRSPPSAPRGTASAARTRAPGAPRAPRRRPS